jgi:hypothetical protein
MFSCSFEQASALTLGATQLSLDLSPLLVCMVLHYFVPSNTNHARPFRCRHEGHTSCPYIPPSSYPNNLGSNTSPDVSKSTDMPTPNLVVDPTHPPDVLGRERRPKFDALDQPWGSSSSFISSTHLDALLDISARLLGTPYSRLHFLPESYITRCCWSAAVLQ